MKELWAKLWRTPIDPKTNPAGFGFAMILVFAWGWTFACSKQVTTDVKTATADFCAARAAYKALAAAANGKLDPAPGSPRAKLEAEEDKLCAVVGK